MQSGGARKGCSHRASGVDALQVLKVREWGRSDGGPEDRIGCMDVVEAVEDLHKRSAAVYKREERGGTHIDSVVDYTLHARRVVHIHSDCVCMPAGLHALALHGGADGQCGEVEVGRVGERTAKDHNAARFSVSMW